MEWKILHKKGRIFGDMLPVMVFYPRLRVFRFLALLVLLGACGVSDTETDALRRLRQSLYERDSLRATRYQDTLRHLRDSVAAADTLRFDTLTKIN
ncbi:MAG: hypothetical protein OHK0039_24710 [Bacteroidia bacterium]